MPKKTVRGKKSSFLPNTLKNPLFILLCLIAAAFFLVLFLQKASAQHPSTKKLLTHPLRKFRKVCDVAQKGKAACHAHVVTDDAGNPLASGSLFVGSYGPNEFHIGYNLPCTPGGATQSVCVSPAVFGPQTIAIVDAYHAPTIENDLNVYSARYGIPPCTQANGCLQIVDQNGGTSLPTIVNGGWALETSLDVEVAHAICQTCKILLVEASSNSFFDLATGVNTAARMGATAISNSYGASEWSGETAYDSFYNHPGVAVTASSGDSGYGTGYPAASQYVVAVGGTKLDLYTDSTYASESAWSGAGSGCSLYESASVWQISLANWTQTGCGARRAIADVSADADPNTGAAVYDSTPYNKLTGWWQVGGTSLASPIIAGVYALTGGVAYNTNAASIPYSSFNLSNSHDVITGSNGFCGTIMCNSLASYDGPTGLGTPNTFFGFTTIVATPTPTLTPTPTSSPTPTLTPTPTPPPDTTAPSVAITSPANGALVPRNTTITIAADAQDNVGVTKVEFYVNGFLKCTDTTPSYICRWRVPTRRGVTYTLMAKAYDAAGNTASSIITVKSN